MHERAVANNIGGSHTISDIADTYGADGIRPKISAGQDGVEYTLFYQRVGINPTSQIHMNKGVGLNVPDNNPGLYIITVEAKQGNNVQYKQRS